MRLPKKAATVNAPTLVVRSTRSVMNFILHAPLDENPRVADLLCRYAITVTDLRLDSDTLVPIGGT